jgi:quinohemoprotein ethanol dehydrogenase
VNRARFAAGAALLTPILLGAAISPSHAAIPDTHWKSHGGTPDESGFAPLTSIDRRNVGTLGLAWSLDLPGEVSLEATPLEVDGVLYFSGSYAAVYAVDVATGKQLWKYDPQTWKYKPHKMHFSFGVNRGVAYADGRVFVAALDGRLIALDAKTGQELWAVDTVPASSLNIITGAPRTFNGKVIVGNGGADFGARGFVTAYDAATGKQVWRFFTVPGTPEENKGDPAMERAAATWSGEYWKTGTGGTVWNGITFDPELNRLYLGTGNGGPYDVSKRSPGDGHNLYLCSIVAVDAGTGNYLWHYQVNPRESWDYKATANMIAATLTIEGKPRKVLMQAPTNGFFYVLDRETGKVISAEKMGKVTWAERIDLTTGRPVEAKNIRYETGEMLMWPGPIGGHNWQDMSFNPKTGLAYVPYMQLGVLWQRGKPNPERMGVFDITLQPVVQDEDDGKGQLVAWDPIQQKARWRVRHDSLWNGGTLSTAGGLVFQGTADGYFSAYDADTGNRLWRFNAGLGIVSPPISYAVGGKQYVSVLVGYGGTTAVFPKQMNMGWKYGAQPRRLLTFSLDGKAVLATTPPADMKVHAVDDRSLQIDDTDVVAGRALINSICVACHGLNLESSGTPAPDLRESGIALYQESLWTVLHEGTLMHRGMPRFETLTKDQVRQIHAYIRAGAREVLGTRKPSATEAPAAGGRL